MKPLITFISLLFLKLAFSQDKRNITTDSSTIEIEKSILGNTTTYESINNKNLIYYIFQNKKSITEIQGQYDKTKNSIGAWKYFTENGELIRTENYTTRTWTINKKNLYPYIQLLNKMKAKADAIVIATYGKDFYNKYAKWNFEGSYYYFNEMDGNQWTDTTIQKPISFLFRYDIQFNEETVYQNMIEFELDKNGHFKGDDSEDTYGFEKLPKKSPKIFTLIKSNALQIAKQKGLKENDSTKAESFMKWEGYKTNNFYNGHYRYYIIIKTDEIREIHPEKRSNITEKFDAYVFNPWTSEFIEIKKMKSIRSWEAMSGNNTGLIPDKD
jgi:hypothetical protein